MKRILPLGPRRAQHVIHETTWPIAYGAKPRNADFQIRFAVLIRYMALIIPVTEPVGQTSLG